MNRAARVAGLAALVGAGAYAYREATGRDNPITDAAGQLGDTLAGWWPYSKKGKSTMRDPNLPRGIRNCNPGNLDNNGIDWLGLSADQTDSRFYQFDRPVDGIRALARVLKNYQRLHGINTLRGVIDRWAPSHENNTSAYLSAVSRETGISPDAPIDLTRESTLALIVPAIIRHENGEQPYAASLITDAIERA